MKQEAVASKDSLDVFAALVALVTHPAIIGMLGLLTIVTFSVSDIREQLFYLILLTALTFIPAALYLLVFFRGNVADALELVNREARLIPYILMVVGALMAIIVLIAIEAPRPIFVMTLVLLANEIVMGTINFWTKVSIHTSTPTFTGITLGYLVSPGWYALIFLVPLIAWARVYRKRHTLQQVIGGTVFAAIITLIVIFLSHQYL